MLLSTNLLGDLGSRARSDSWQISYGREKLAAQYGRLRAYRQINLTFSALGPLGPLPSVNETRCPS